MHRKDERLHRSLLPTFPFLLFKPETGRFDPQACATFNENGRDIAVAAIFWFRLSPISSSE